MEGDAAVMGMGAVFEQEDALPGSQRHAPARDRYGQLHIGQRALDMGGHIVRPLDGMAIKPWVFRDQLVEEAFQVPHYIGVGIFLNGQ